MPRRLRLLAPALAAAALLATSSALHAQYPDAYVIPRGALRIGFEPSYLQWSERFAANGNLEPFGTDFTDSVAGVRWLPSLRPAQSALRTLLGDSSLTLVLGRVRTTRVGDVRVTPLTFALGITDRLTVTAALPIVTARSQVDFVVDSTDGNLGWNQAAAASGSANGAAQVQQLLGQIAAAAAAITARIAAECPGGAQCAELEAVLARTNDAQTLLMQLSGLSTTPLPPFAPLASSAEGQALQAHLQALAADLQALGAGAITAAYPLPAQRVGAEAVTTVLADSTFGYDAYAIEFAKYRNRLGDAELGLRFGLVQAPRLRAVVFSTVRFPTGTRDLPEHFVDIGTGDRQLDVEAGMEATWVPGVVALALRGSYTAQLSDELPLRVTPHTEPIALAADQYTVTRNLGDVLRLSVYPSLRLSEAFVAYGAASYFRRSADTYAAPPGGFSECPGTCPDPGVLAFETEMRSWSFGGGLHYRAARGRHEARLPVEAGVDYVAAFHGSGGQTPKASQVTFYLRLYRRLWGAAETAETTEATEPTEVEQVPPGGR